MSDMHEALDREARRVNASEEAVALVRRLAQLNQRRRRIAIGIVALAITGAGLGLSYAAFDHSGAKRPAAGPTLSSPGPTRPSFRIDNHTGLKSLSYKVSFIVSDMFDASGFSEGSTAVRDRTEIRFGPEGEEGARTLARRLLPGAPVRGGVPPGMEIGNGVPDVVLVLGRDYKDYRLATAIDAYEMAEQFVATRNNGAESEKYLAPEAAAQYEQHEGGLQLYSYWPEGQEFSISGPMVLPVSWNKGENVQNPTLGLRVSATQTPKPVTNPDDHFFTFQELIQENLLLELQDDGRFLVVDAWRLPLPAPSPTPTGDEPIPAPVQVEVADGTGNPHATSYLGLLLQDRGRGDHHGGYSIVATIDPTTGDFIGMEKTETIDRTVISRVPGANDEAERLRRLFFPDAEIRGRIQGSESGAPIEIHLGRDFLVTEEEGLAAFNFVDDFLTHRLVGSRAERYLSPGALRLYESGRGGLSLYGYSSDEVGVRALHEGAAGSWRAVVALSGDRKGYEFETLELIRVSDTDISQWSITYAERNE